MSKKRVYTEYTHLSLINTIIIFTINIFLCSKKKNGRYFILLSEAGIRESAYWLGNILTWNKQG